MGRALSVTSEVAKKIIIPRDIISIDLYVQCKILEFGLEIVYNDNALVYFLPPNKVFDFASQVIRAAIGHKQLHAYYSRFRSDIRSFLSYYMLCNTSVLQIESKRSGIG